MKTPRELLLEHHRPTEPKLDAIREQLLAELRQADHPQVTASFWDKLIMPLRWHLAGLTAIWIMIALLNTHQPAVKEITANVSSTEELFVAMQENRRQVLELTEATTVDAPKLAQPYIPRRRSQAVPSFAIA